MLNILFYEYSHILWVIFYYLIHVLNINFKIKITGQPENKFILVFKYFKLKTVLKVIKPQYL